MRAKRGEMFNEQGALELYVRDLAIGFDLSDDFVQRMIPMIRAIFAPGVPLEKRETLVSIAMASVIRWVGKEHEDGRSEREARGVGEVEPASPRQVSRRLRRVKGKARRKAPSPRKKNGTSG